MKLYKGDNECQADGDQIKLMEDAGWSRTPPESTAEGDQIEGDQTEGDQTEGDQTEGDDPAPTSRRRRRTGS